MNKLFYSTHFPNLTMFRTIFIPASFVLLSAPLYLYLKDSLRIQEYKKNFRKETVDTSLVTKTCSGVLRNYCFSNQQLNPFKEDKAKEATDEEMLGIRDDLINQLTILEKELKDSQIPLDAIIKRFVKGDLTELSYPILKFIHEHQTTIAQVVPAIIAFYASKQPINLLCPKYQTLLQSLVAIGASYGVYDKLYPLKEKYSRNQNALALVVPMCVLFGPMCIIAPPLAPFLLLAIVALTSPEYERPTDLFPEDWEIKVSDHLIRQGVYSRRNLNDEILKLESLRSLVTDEEDQKLLDATISVMRWVRKRLGLNM
jgi:hypothetical protein